MSKHLAWIVPVLLTLLGGVLWLNMSLVSLRKDVDFIEMRIEKIIEHCCDLERSKLWPQEKDGQLYYGAGLETEPAHGREQRLVR
jgi:hypothetical protein